MYYEDFKNITILIKKRNEGESVNRLVVFTLLAALAVSITLPSTVYRDELTVVFESWRSGRPVVLVKLNVIVPKIDADECFVAIHRFPTMYAPTGDRTERLFAEVVTPGTTVSVSKFIPGIPVKTHLDEKTNQYVIDYYEPQEFIIITHCVKGNTTVFKFSRIVEVYPRNIVHREDVDVGKLAEELRKGQSTSIHTSNVDVRDDGSSAGSPQFSCNIECSGGRCWCITWVSGPYLYSIEGLETSFCLYHDRWGISSAVYIEGFFDITSCPGSCSLKPQWSSVGKVLTPAIVGGCTQPGLQGYNKVRIYFNVTYRYEENWWCDQASGVCWIYRFLYPEAIGGVGRADVLGVESLSPYIPQRPTSGVVVVGPALGDKSIYFDGIFKDYYTYRSDISIASVNITFNYARFWSTTLEVHFYGCGVIDRQYTTPYVKVVDVSGKAYQWYYWWYKPSEMYSEGDPMTYEILFSP